MSGASFVSYAQNGEDVVLWRALGHVAGGRYVDIGAGDPIRGSVTKAFHDRGWTGINVEPEPGPFDLLREQRPDDINVRAAVSAQESADADAPTARVDGLLDAHLGADAPVHFLRADVDGAEADVLATLDLKRWRPWVLLVQSTPHESGSPARDDWEPDVLASGYRFCLFDGISCYYVAEERADLVPALSYPACALDAFVPHSQVELVAERDALLADLIRWRGAALRSRDAIARERTEKDRIADEVQAAHRAAAAAGTDLLATKATLSWRVTKPLRAVRRFGPRPSGR